MAQIIYILFTTLICRGRAMIHTNVSKERCHLDWPRSIYSHQESCHTFSVVTRWCSGYHAKLALRGDAGSNPARDVNFSFISRDV